MPQIARKAVMQGELSWYRYLVQSAIRAKVMPFEVCSPYGTQCFAGIAAIKQNEGNACNRK